MFTRLRIFLGGDLKREGNVSNNTNNNNYFKKGIPALNMGAGIATGCGLDD
jgi:hypothetical protein